MASSNPYEPLSEEQKLKIENEKKAIEAKKANVIKLAAECLADQKFARYREAYEDLRKTAMKSLSDRVNPNPAEDAHFLRACINTILVLDMLLELPQKDLKREGV